MCYYSLNSKVDIRGDHIVKSENRFLQTGLGTSIHFQLALHVCLL